MGEGIHPNLDEATLISPNLDKFIKPQNVAKQSWDQEAASLLSSWHPLRDRQKVKRDLKQKKKINKKTTTATTKHYRVRSSTKE